MFKTENCDIVNVKECDILYQVDYTRKCDECGYTESKERCFKNVLKSGYTLDIDNWKCPHCNKLCITTIEVDNC